MLTVATILALTTLAASHGGVLSYLNAGITYQGFVPYNTPVGQNTIQRQWATYDPILDPLSSTISCNNDGTSIAGQLDNFTIAAGSQVKAFWNQVWPHPYGPMLTYLAKCPGTTCTGVNTQTLQWFKIDQSGLISGTIGQGSWGSGKMINDNSTWTSTIPATVPAGPYMLRFETIALHSLPAQFYPECAQVHITGSGTRAPTAAELVSFPGAYSATDPGINVDLYSQANQVATNYVIPGPPLYGGSAATTTTGQTSTTATTTKTTTVTSPTSTGSVGQYGQCGGSTYTGPTVCVSPYRCVYVNDFYSQCLV